MSAYNENLQQTVLAVLTDLQKQQQKLASDDQTALFNLYYAQGAEITARDKLNSVIKAYGKAVALDEQGVQNDNLATNLLASATEYEENVAATVTNSAMAASNVQIASKAIAQLAADIGSAFNIVSAADYESDIVTSTARANDFIVETAYSAEDASRMSMEATAAETVLLQRAPFSFSVVRFPWMNKPIYVTWPT